MNNGKSLQISSRSHNWKAKSSASPRSIFIRHRLASYDLPQFWLFQQALCSVDFSASVQSTHYFVMIEYRIWNCM